MEKTRKRALGRGLEALLGSAATPDDGGGREDGRDLITCDLKDIEPFEDQPRRHFEQDRLNELAQSIKEQGLLQPLLVRRHPTHEGRYQLVIGERRWRACKLAGLHAVPVMVRDFDDADSFARALVENLQREDLNPLEIAWAYEKMIAQREVTQEDLARFLGKDRSHIANHLRLLKLEPSVRTMLMEGALSFGHARALAGVADLVVQRSLAATVVEKELSVRQTEDLVRRSRLAPPKRPEPSEQQRSAERSRQYLEQMLRHRLGGGVRLRYRHGAGKGRIELPFADLNELDRLLTLLGVEADRL